MQTTSRDNADEQSVSITAGSVQLEGILLVPDAAEGVILFAHDGSSSLYSTRNRYMAHVLHQAGLATLLLSLITSEEEVLDVRTKQFRLDVALLRARLVSATDWLIHNPNTCHLRIGYLGDGLAGGAALLAATVNPLALGAIALYNGQINIDHHQLLHVQAPTLLIVDGNDEQTVAINQYALSHIRVEKKLELISRASHLFAEPSALEEVARLASQWFKHYLTATAPRTSPDYPADS
ncbi:dienelactone hydrolase family protein [Stenomitos frigidus]|uniref:Hydrolase n=1 Tax=Stenomitos frigidus ULC18 TaxID=2107698 RepID=A0A2T1E7F1_9CYAN|nr:dienelactone hydrolase family protein [Stenomitos frigidus]PSB28666.1 hydrolase [Stenomitos frigidus ULC18]